jgi:hypothetical protein
MKALLLFLTLCSGFCFAQKFTYPTVRAEGKTIQDFVPKGWVILASAVGDLNKDNLPDAAIILQHKDSTNFIETLPGGDTMHVVTQPRILIVLLKNAADNQFHLAAQNNDFVMLHDQPNIEEPFQEMKIAKGTLQLDYQLFCNMGCSDITNITYKFRYQGNDFALIGADYNSINRMSHAGEAYSFNFLTRKRTHGISKSDNDKGTGDTKPINITSLKTLKTLKQALSWQVEKDFYL